MPVISRLSIIPFTPITIHLSQVETWQSRGSLYGVMSNMRCIVVEKYDCVFSPIIYVTNCEKKKDVLAMLVARICIPAIEITLYLNSGFRYVLKLAGLTILYYFHNSLSHKTSEHLVS